MGKNEILEILETIAEGIELSPDSEVPTQSSQNNSEIIRALCIAVASLISKHPPAALRSTKYIKDALNHFKEGVEIEMIFSVIEDTNYDLQKAAEEMGITYRELNSKIRALGIGTEIAIDALWKNPETEYLVVVRDMPLDKFLKKIEKEIIYSASEETNFDKQKAAELLNISFRSLRYRIDNLRIKRDIKLGRTEKKMATDYFQYFKDLPLDQVLSEIEKKAILEALEKSNQNKTVAADKLGISFRSLRYRIENYGIMQP